ncbi:hypothetical protein RhiirA5_441688, partial [Rhizophagus irregularis]
MYQPKKYVTKYTEFTEKCDKYKSYPIRGGIFKCGSKKRSESLKLMKNNKKIKNIPIGHCHQDKPGEFPQCYQQKKPMTPSNIPIGNSIHCHQNKPVKLGECLQCYQQKKPVTSSKIENIQQKKPVTPLIENIPIGKCIHCHKNKPVKLGECLQCYQQKKPVTPSKIESIPVGECIHCHQNKP